MPRSGLSECEVILVLACDFLLLFLLCFGTILLFLKAMLILFIEYIDGIVIPFTMMIMMMIVIVFVLKVIIIAHHYTDYEGGRRHKERT